MDKQPKICNLCGALVEFVDSSIVYGKSYGMIYKCTKCDARVSVHKGTRDAMGILADRELREIKKLCHLRFDNSWKSGLTSRRNAYKKLAKELNIPIEECHIGYFSMEQCLKLLYKR